MDIKRNGRNGWFFNSELNQVCKKLDISPELSGQEVLKALLTHYEIVLSPLRELNRVEKNLPENTDITELIAKQKQKEEVKTDITKDLTMENLLIRAKKYIALGKTEEQLKSVLINLGIGKNPIKEIIKKTFAKPEVKEEELF